MKPESVDERSLIALARAAGFDIPPEDVAPLTRALGVCAQLVAKLDAAELDVADVSGSIDPRVGW
jgi:hypothetical protein